MRLKPAAILLALMLLFVATVPATAITNGQPDNGRHPYVGIVAFYVRWDDVPDKPAWSCSGSLIAPTVVLTAGHCTDGAVAALVSFADDVNQGLGDISAGLPYTYPGYVASPHNGNGLPSAPYRDVGVVGLIEPVAAPQQYAQLPTPGQVDTLPNKTAVDFVGYGVQRQVKDPDHPGQPPIARWTDAGVRMRAPSELVSGKFVNSADTMRLALNPGGGSGGACFGDSGGPNLLGGTATVLAVNSFLTNVNCSGVGYSARVDVPEVLQWVRSCLS